jgi:hypothetical protein
VFVASLVVLLHAKDEMFGGKWVLDKASARPADAPNNLEVRIKQDGSGVTFENVFKEPENGVVPLLYLGLMTTKLRLGTDGAEQQNTVGPFQMASKTTLNGFEMQTDWNAMVQGDQVQGRWTHRLSDDGKHMTWEIEQNSPQGRHAEATLHFVRK